MFWVALLGPALISMSLFEGREIDNCKMFMEWVKIFLIRAFLICLISQSIIIYIFRLDGVSEAAFSSFPFFIKYCLIAIIVAIVVSFVHFVIRRVLKMNIEVGVYHEDDNETKR